MKDRSINRRRWPLFLPAILLLAAAITAVLVGCSSAQKVDADSQQQINKALAESRPRTGATIMPPQVGKRMMDLQAAFDQDKASLSTLYNSAVHERNVPAGEIRLDLTITPDGQVSACSIVSSTLHDAAFEQSVVEETKRFHLPARDFSQVVVSHYPIVFYPSP